ncbi:MAG: hypothetical protein EXR70_09630 [Deltaproteobacteria bacterium]|nr:hypothetical protein [Deltaproteobacteria bacterium]
MLKYRARLCPKCDYYVGFATPTPEATKGTVSVTNFCLNCNYKLPMHTVLRGPGRPNRLARRASLRLVHRTGQALQEPELVTAPTEIRINPSDYACHLRAIGQDLENLHLASFNLECTGTAYLVWVRNENQADNTNPLFRISRSRLQKLWRNKSQPIVLGQEESYTLPTAQTGHRLRYSVQELDRIEREQRAHRRYQSGTADGHSLPQLMRTVGDMIGQRGERLLGISWQDLSVSTVVETAEGRKEIDVYRPDNLYDLWVGMFLRRDNRAFSAVPR